MKEGNRGKMRFWISVHLETKGTRPDGNATQHAGCRRGCGLANPSRHTDKTWLCRERALHSLHALDFVTDRKEVEVCVLESGFCVAIQPGPSTGPHPGVSTSQMVSLVTTGQSSAGWTLITIIQGRLITTH